jgi:nucleotide-binding universal stress UspA family protein
METILALIGGGNRDQVILQTALAAALPCSSHLDFLHVHVSPGEAARGSHIEFARGSALSDALNRLEADAGTFSRLAADHIRDFCERTVINIRETVADRRNGITASYHEETDDAIARLTSHGCSSDLIVMGRAKQTQGLPSYTLERLVSRCGSPVLVAASEAPQKLTGTVMVCWNESKSATRAVMAAMPILTRAKRVVVASVIDRHKCAAKAAGEVVERFASLGIKIETKLVPADGRGVAAQLSAAADDCQADLVVMGAYGRSFARHLFFGSRTDAILRQVDRPILLMH